MTYQLTYKDSDGTHTIESVNPSSVKVGDTVRIIILSPRGKMDGGSTDKTGVVTRAYGDDEEFFIDLDNGVNAGFSLNVDENYDRAIQIV